MNRRRVEQFALGLIAVLMLPARLQAALTENVLRRLPTRARLDRTRGWRIHSEHLVRDVGALFLALIIVTVWTLWRHPLARAVAAAWLVQGTLHSLITQDKPTATTVDKLGLIGSDVTVPILALVARWAG